MSTNIRGYHVVAPTPGPAEVLTVEEFSVGAPGPHQLLVHNAAVGVNFIDVYFRSGIYPTKFPYVPGSEGSGTIVEIGSEVTEFSVGENVMWNAAPHSYATHSIVPASNAVRVPSHIDIRTAAAIPLQGLTAHYLATSAYSVAPGDVILVHAGAGGVGLLITQIIKLRGGYVISTVSTQEKETLAQAAGADRVIRYDQLADLTQELPAIVKELSTDLRESTKVLGRGSGVDAVFDGVGKTTFDASLASLRTRGHLILFGGSSGQVQPFDLQRLNKAGSIVITRPSLEHFLLTREELELRSADLFTWLENGQLSFRIGATYPLHEAAKAHEALESRATTGKTLLIP